MPATTATMIVPTGVSIRHPGERLHEWQGASLSRLLLFFEEEFEGADAWKRAALHFAGSDKTPCACLKYYQTAHTVVEQMMRDGLPDLVTFRKEEARGSLPDGSRKVILSCGKYRFEMPEFCIKKAREAFLPNYREIPI